MIKELEQGKRLFCLCDHPGCDKVKYSLVDPAWQMKSFVFGVHPVILGRLDRPAKCVKEEYHFCQEHFPRYKEFLNDLLGKVITANYTFNSNKELERSKGCWITVVDVLGGQPPMNYQMSITPFEVTFENFSAFIESHR